MRQRVPGSCRFPLPARAPFLLQLDPAPAPARTAQCPLTASCPSQPVLCNSTDDRGGSFSFPCGIWTSYYRCVRTALRAVEIVGYVAIDRAWSGASLSRQHGSLKRG